MSPAATKPNAKDQHYSSGIGWRRMKAWHGTRETNKCWGNEIKNILTDVPVVDDPRTFVSENQGHVTIRRGTELFSSGGAAAPGVVKRVRTAHFNTKIMPHIGPTVFGGEEKEPTSVDDMTELCRRKLDSKRTPTPVTKASGKGRRDSDDRRVSGGDLAAQAPGRPENVVCLREVHTSERLTLLPRQISPRRGEERSKALVCLTLTMTERKTLCEPRRSERGRPCEPQGMEKIATNAMIKKVATCFCDGEEGSDGRMELVAVMCL